jgi:hypothetical protein
MPEPFVPTFIFDTELSTYGLPTADQVPHIMNHVQLASAVIDEHCGRIDGDGNGSLVYTTYQQRILLQTRNRNIIQLPIKPIVPVDAQTATDLSNLAASGNFNYWYTGVLPNTQNQLNGSLSGIIAASGRYGYTRQDMSVGYSELFSAINPMNLVTVFGGPAPWVSIDITNTDYDPKTGEVWIPAGLQLQRYSEVVFTYNSGFDPRRMPYQVKLATAAVTKNILGKGAGTTGLQSMSLSKSGANAQFYMELVDPNVDRLLTAFKSVRAY